MRLNSAVADTRLLLFFSKDDEKEERKLSIKEVLMKSPVKIQQVAHTFNKES